MKKINKIITSILVGSIMLIQTVSPVLAQNSNGGIMAVSDDEIETVSLAKQQVIDYMAEAKQVYADDTDYSETLAPDLYDSIWFTDECDIPNPVNLSWNAVAGATSYTLYISKSDSFPENDTLVFENITSTSKAVYHLYVNTQYYWRAVSNNGVSTDVKTFKTANTIRFMKVDGMRNVRDIGGWNGLNQGLVYRGTEINGVTLNAIDNSYFEATEEGKRVMLEEMGIKTDVDFRRAGDDSGNITASPLGDSVTWALSTLGSYTSCLKEENMYKFRDVLSIFADPANYPVYFHCYGGADRTGIVAFLLEALAGASETDLSIDFEATTFAHKVGYRRRNHPQDLQAVVVTGVDANGQKAYKPFREYGGDTINEQVENYALYIGLTRSQISNIRSILGGNGVTFKSTYNVETGNNVPIQLVNLSGHTVKSVAFGNETVAHTLSGNTLRANLADEGTYTITLDDDTTLVFDAYTPVYPEVSLIQSVNGEEKTIEAETVENTNVNGGTTALIHSSGQRITYGNNRYAEWTVNVDEAGLYDFSVIANSTSAEPYLTLSIVDGDNVTDIGTAYVENDNHQDCINHPFTTVLPSVNLKEGNNVIRLTFSGEGGNVGMDKIIYSLSAKDVTEFVPGTYKAKANISVLNEDQKKDLTFIAAVYNGNSLVKATIKDADDADNNVITINDLQVGENGTVKLFMWDKTSLKPIMPNTVYEIK